MNAHRVRLDPAALAVEPGREAVCTVRIANAGDVVDAFNVEVLGAAAAWTAVEPASVSLFPGAEGTARLTFRPPRSSDVPAGTLPFAVRVQSQAARLDTSVVEEGTVEVGRFTELAADLVPRTSHGIFSGRHSVELTNHGNAATTVRLSGSDAERALDLVFASQAVPVWPGTTRSARLKARTTGLSLTGAPRQWSFKVVAEADATAPVELQGAMEQRPLLGRGTRRALAIGAIALVGLAIYGAKGDQLKSAASGMLNGTRAAQVAPGTPNSGGGAQSPGGSTPATGTSPSPSPSTGGTGGTTGGGSGAATQLAAIVPAAACAGSAVSNSSPNPAQAIPGLAVTVNNGGAARQALVQLSANLGVDSGAEVRVAYSVDGGPGVENAFGPANFANHQEYYETRAVTAVIPLGPGSHTITPSWRISGAAGKTAYMDKRCLTVKSALSGPPSSSAVVAAAACAGNAISTSAPNGAAAIPALAVTVDNGSVARQALVEVSANLGVDIDAELRLAYSVDGGPAQENAFGPANLANHQEYYEARDVTAVIPLGAGTHSIAALWRVSGAAGKTAYMDRRCLTVESAAPASAGGPLIAASCPGSSVSTSAPSGAAPMPGLSVTFDNGGSARVALVTVSANLGVDIDAEVRLAYSVDGGPAQENASGPANLANHQQYYEGRDATAVIPLGPGAHTVVAYWRVSGAAGKTAYMDKRCLTVESVAT